MRSHLQVAVLLAILQQATAISYAITLGMCQSRLRSRPSGMASRWRSPSMEIASSLHSSSLWMWLAPLPPWRRSGTSWARV